MFPVSSLSFLADLSSDAGGSGNGVLSVEHSWSCTPPLAVSFCKTLLTSHLLAVSDEVGYVSMYDTRGKLPSYDRRRDKTGETRVSDWLAHENAIFDVAWMEDGTGIWTASGDQTIRRWDVEKRRCLSTLSWHTGSVKSISCNSSNPYLIVSGSRDGSIALWDIRCSSGCSDGHGEAYFTPTAIVKQAHTQIERNRKRSKKGGVTSITSVLYLKDDVSIASSGAADNVVRFWDTRNLKTSHLHASPHTESRHEKGRGNHGISCLSQDLCGTYIAASCTDDRIYLYDVLRLHKGAVRSYSGSKIDSFFVKSGISPDRTHILGGSSDGNAYIWQVEEPTRSPICLEGHTGEVTAVDWCAGEIGKIATSSDDFTVRVWREEKKDYGNMRSPVINRKRVTLPSNGITEVCVDEARENLTNRDKSGFDPKELSWSSPLVPQTMHSSGDEGAPASNDMPGDLHSLPAAVRIDFSTPERGTKRNRESDNLMSPESETNSPASVLHPPPSSKRKTILDYFTNL